MRKILVVDDDRQICEFVQSLLKEAGFTVSVAGDGLEAMELLRRDSFDLMLLDVHMPRMGGLELLEYVRSQPERPKVVVMTAYNSPETVLGALREQACRYVIKPFAPRILLEAVLSTLDDAHALPHIEVVSAKPEWVELLVPCQLGVVDRVQSFLQGLKVDLPDEVRESVGQAFRELLLNAIEWGGQLDPNRQVRIAYLRTERMLLYRIADPGRGFHFEDLKHAALGNPTDEPYGHLRVREEKGLRPGGFGLLVTQQKVDELVYNEAQNEVVFVKYLRECVSP